MIYYLFLTLSESYDCFSKNVQLNGIQSEYALYLTMDFDNESATCAQYVGMPLMATLTFENENTIPAAMTQYLSTLGNVKSLSIKFTFDSTNFFKIMENSAVNYLIVLRSQFNFAGTIPFVNHVTFDSRHCWDQVTFSVDSDFAFNISVLPLACTISKQVSVYLDYFNESWIGIPILPQAPSALPNFQTGDYFINNVKYFNTDSVFDPTNALLITNFVKFFKKNLKTQLRLRIEETDPTLYIKQVFLSTINTYSNYFTKNCYTAVNQNELQENYSFMSANTQQIFDCGQLISGAIDVKIDQIDYSDKQAAVSTKTIQLAEIKTVNGLKMDFNASIKVNDEQYQYLTLIQFIDAQGVTLQTMYFQGTSILSCFHQMQPLVYENLMCLKIYPKTTQTCKTLFQTNLTGTFRGIYTPENANDKITYFWLSQNSKIDLESNSGYQKVCYTETDESGQYQGTKATGSFNDRIKAFYNKCYMKESTCEVSFYGLKETIFMNTNQIMNYQTKSTFIWVSIAGVIAVICGISGIAFVNYRSSQ
ncbi:Conserved_hypothetical protein [Hexamita inflata]|uniref:Transmembrane protein n=1 Tax=Hexamita inflata TaxID=28002 RepID=A0AA86URV9_9EUKA|nr:Conserved hypothetical protein [Hexamita inflata]